LQNPKAFDWIQHPEKLTENERLRFNALVGII